MALEPAELDACVGEYESLNGIPVKVVRAGDHLAIIAAAQPGVEIFPASPLEFFTKDGGVQYTFVVASRGVVVRYLRAAGGGRGVPARRLGAS